MAKKTEQKQPSAWEIQVGGFANAVGVDLSKIQEALVPIIGEPDEESAGLLADEISVPTEDLKNALVVGLQIPSGKFNLHLHKLRGVEAVVSKPEQEKTSNIGNMSAMLPQIPDDESFLDMLKTGGVLKVSQTEVISAVKAALSQKVGLFQIPDIFLVKMEEHALSTEEPFGETFYQIQTLLTQNKYGDVLSAMGMKGSYISERRKKDFFERVNSILWDSVIGFHDSLSAWYDSWLQTAGSSAMIVAMVSAKNGPDLQSMMNPPSIDPLRDAAETFVDKLNKIFAGPGIPVARALAYDATRIMEILEQENLPVQIGTTTRDEMLKKLGVSVGSEIVRAEKSLSQYVLSIMSLSKVGAEDEINYLAAMHKLGSSIPWSKLDIVGGGRSSTL